MKRRAFINSAAVVSATGLAGKSPAGADHPSGSPTTGTSFAVDDTQITFHTDAITQPFNVLVVTVHGIRFLTIDNSNYEIFPEQLEFFRTQVAGGQPLVLLLHIPLYAPGRLMGFGCGNPK